MRQKNFDQTPLLLPKMRESSILPAMLLAALVVTTTLASHPLPSQRVIHSNHHSIIHHHMTTTTTHEPPATELLETSTKLKSSITFPLDPSDSDFMCRGVATTDGYAQPCDMYVVIPGSSSLRSNPTGFAFLRSPGYVVRLFLIALPGIFLTAIMMYWSIQCCCYRRVENSTERHADKCLMVLSAWRTNMKDDPDLYPPRYPKVQDNDYPRMGITDSCYFSW